MIVRVTRRRFLVALLVAFTLGAVALRAAQIISPWCHIRVENKAWYPVVVSQFGVNPDGSPYRRDLAKAQPYSVKTYQEWCVNPR